MLWLILLSLYLSKTIVFRLHIMAADLIPFSCFAKQWILRNQFLMLIINWNKVMQISAPFVSATFLYSYLFLGMPLAEFPDCLSFPNMTKGSYPYYFTDFSYVGSNGWHSIKMNDSERRKFNIRYKAKCKNTCTFCDEIYYYCKSDADILRKRCLIFFYQCMTYQMFIPFMMFHCWQLQVLPLKFKQKFLKRR